MVVNALAGRSPALVLLLEGGRDGMDGMLIVSDPPTPKFSASTASCTSVGSAARHSATCERSVTTRARSHRTYSAASTCTTEVPPGAAGKSTTPCTLRGASRRDSGMTESESAICIGCIGTLRCAE